MGVGSLVGTGGALTLASLAALAFGYAPAVFIASDSSLETLSISAKCDGGVKLELGAHFGEPTLLASHVAVRFTLDKIARCKSFWIATNHPGATVTLLSSEAVFPGEKRETTRVVPFKVGSTAGTRIFEFETKGLSRHWIAVVDHAFAADRTGFDRYSVAGNLSLVPGDWKFAAASTADYNTTGQTELAKTVVSEERPENRDLAFRVTATFPRATEHKDVFIILVSTLLGVAVSSLIQGATTTPERRRREGTG